MTNTSVASPLGVPSLTHSYTPQRRQREAFGRLEGGSCDYGWDGTAERRLDSLSERGHSTRKMDALMRAPRL
ncbi:MAG: hypothetical protein LBU32_01720 [Clostridiales bacterium]|nr:hypothetical protein [Clostridiales bacterium]